MSHDAEARHPTPAALLCSDTSVAADCSMLQGWTWSGPKVAKAAAAALAAAPLVFTSSYTIGVLTVALCYGIWAASWDFMSGLTGRENFGHSLFVGAGAYTAGFLNVGTAFQTWLTAL